MERRDEKCNQTGNGTLEMEKGYGFNDESRLTPRPVLFSRKMTKPECGWLPGACEEGRILSTGVARSPTALARKQRDSKGLL